MSKSIFLQRPHERDFDYYLTHLKERDTTTTVPDILEKLKVLHRKVFYLNYLSTSLQVDKKERIYLKEIVTDLILCMDLFSMNYLKPSRMSLRAAIEEFNRLLLVRIKEEVENLGVYKLNEKVKEKFREDIHTHGKIAQLLSDYKQLCGFTHVSDNNNFTEKLVLEDFRIINRSELNLITNQIVRVIENMIFIIICQNKRNFLKLNKHQQAFIITEIKDSYQEEINKILDK